MTVMDIDEHMANLRIDDEPQCRLSRQPSFGDEMSRMRLTDTARKGFSRQPNIDPFFQSEFVLSLNPTKFDIYVGTKDVVLVMVYDPTMY
jgi:hypothetical protein